MEVVGACPRMETGRWSGADRSTVVGVGASVGRRDRPLLENCTVDASIPDVQVLFLDFCSIFVVCRSLEGHMVDALALGAEEGRCSLR